MQGTVRLPTAVVMVLAAVAASLCVRSDSAFPVHASPRMAGLPRLTLWAWERREDLRGIDPRAVAVATLDQTVTIGLTVESTPRRNPVWLPAGTTRIAVVRIETGSRGALRGAVLNEANRDAAAAAILRSAEESGGGNGKIGALQIDFDATRSQRPFYRSLLEEVRARMPAGLPLSITALASWCSQDRWLGELPIDEAVPMMFRMEPHKGPAEDFRIREPLCAGAVGVSTTEPWPAETAGRRVYVFSDNGWAVDSPDAVERRVR
jgi:uncharacterized protein DUF3142